MGQSFFHFKQFSITQQDKGLKVGSDACLLGSIASHHSPHNCLDIGTGTGVIALMLAQRYPKAAVAAIEIQEEVYGQAVHNISSSMFSERLKVTRGDFLRADFGDTFDLIVCNPPYYKNHLRTSDPEKNIALHNSSLPFEALTAKVKTLLSPGGKFWVILPHAEMEQLKAIASHEGLNQEELINIYNKPGKLFRQVACFSATPQGNMVKELLMHDAEGKRTIEYETLMRDFYLENTEIYRRPR